MRDMRGAKTTFDFVCRIRNSWLQRLEAALRRAEFVEVGAHEYTTRLRQSQSSTFLRRMSVVSVAVSYRSITGLKSVTEKYSRLT